MTVETRSITENEIPTFRRLVRAGFGSAETSDEDLTWAHDATQPVDRALACFDADQIVATLRSFPTELTVPGGRVVPAGAVTAVTCQPTHRRQGLLTRMMGQDLRASADRGEVADVLIASEYPIYGRYGYGPAVVSTSWELDKTRATFRNPGTGSIEIVDNETLRKEGPALLDRVRAQRPGMISRTELMWDHATDLRRPPEDKPWHGFRLLCRDDDGVAQGWASWSVKDNWEGMRPRSTVRVADLCAATPDAEARIWSFLADLDLTATLRADDRSADELLPYLLHDARAAKQTERFDFLWVRPLDVVGALESRSYDVAGSLVLDVTDPLGIADGRYALDASPEGASCRRTDAGADLTLPVAALGAVCLGGTRLRMLHAAGWLDEESAGAVSLADQVFSGSVTPWCNTWF